MVMGVELMGLVLAASIAGSKRTGECMTLEGECMNL